jgi:hypothetical protein
MRECPYPEITGIAECDASEVFSDWACQICQKACSKKKPALLEMAKIPDLDAVGEEGLDPDRRMIVEALRERGISIDEYDDSYPSVRVFNILRLVPKEKKH